MEQQLDRIATAFEQIANTLESINRNGLDVNLSGSIDLSGSISADIDRNLVYLKSYDRAFKVELSNCTDTETPFDIQIHD
jgi:hypothetical protein